MFAYCNGRFKDYYETTVFETYVTEIEVDGKKVKFKFYFFYQILDSLNQSSLLLLFIGRINFLGYSRSRRIWTSETVKLSGV